MLRNLVRQSVFRTKTPTPRFAALITLQQRLFARGETDQDRLSLKEDRSYQRGESKQREDEQSKVSESSEKNRGIPEDDKYIFIQETYTMEYRALQDEADNFLQESRKRNISDFARGSKSPISFNQSVQVQNSRSLYQPGPGDKGNIVDEEMNPNKEPTV